MAVGVALPALVPTASARALQSADSLPVLPFPKHASVYDEPLALYPAIPVWKAMHPAMISRLSVHWKDAVAGIGDRGKKRPILIGLLGADTAFDRQVRDAAGSRADSVGEQGYVLVLREHGSLLAARSETGLFYGMQTLKQLAAAGWGRELTIADWPSFPLRAVCEDISRGPVPTVAFIKEQIRRMASVKINYLSFYIEHVVKTASHPDFAPPGGHLSIGDLRELSAYAAAYHMQLIGNFQSFGHFEKILSLPQYASMGATTELLSPFSPRARRFLADVIGEMCGVFSAPWFNVDCDETFDLGQGATQPYVARMGLSGVYAAHINYLDSIVRNQGKKLMIWGDFALDHPEVFKLLPPGITYLTWEYGADSSFARWTRPFSSRHLPFVVCPGILNTYRMFPDMVMAKANISGFAEAGLRAGARGLMTTIWDDGEAYLLSADWYGIYLAAEKGWAAGAPSTLSTFDRRYESDAYGRGRSGYVGSLSRLMALRRIPLTYDLTYLLWRDRLLPEAGKRLVMNNGSAPAALRELDSARRLLRAFRPQRNGQDKQTLSMAIDQYNLLLTSRLFIARLAAFYRKASGTPAAIPGMEESLSRYADSVGRFRQAYRQAENRFRAAWRRENQPYWLDNAARPYSEKIAALDTLEGLLRQASAALKSGRSLPKPLEMRLSVQSTRHFYFPNWMLAGPFPAQSDGAFPAFLYSDSTAYDKPPSPGDFTSYLGRRYRWTKYASASGGIVDLDERFGAKGSVVYAYCRITSPEARMLPMVLSTEGTAEVFCNGRLIKMKPAATPQAGKAWRFSLPLAGGQNHILLKLGRDLSGPWDFSLYLPDAAAVTCHKHKYQLYD